MTQYTVNITALGKDWQIDLNEKTHDVEIIGYFDANGKWKLLDSELWSMEVDGFMLVDLLGEVARDSYVETDPLDDPEADYAYNDIGEGR